MRSNRHQFWELFNHFLQGPFEPRAVPSSNRQVRFAEGPLSGSVKFKVVTETGGRLLAERSWWPWIQTIGSADEPSGFLSLRLWDIL